MMDYIYTSPTPYHACENLGELLKDKGFKEIRREEPMNLKDDCYYMIEEGSLIAFRLGEGSGFNIIGSHSDSPCFRIKDNPSMNKEGLKVLNVEPYGGIILRTWLDRNLSIAGRVVLKDFIIKNFNIDKDLMLIPSLAIHMDREVNKEGEIKPQSQMLPIYGTYREEEDFKELIAKEMGLKSKDILSYDILLYDRERGKIWGEENEFFSIARIDNLSMAYLSVKALIDEKKSDKTQVVIINDHEEIGSRTMTGADSLLVRDLLERIAINQGLSREEFLSSLAKSFLISADGAHAVHPNYVDIADPTNRPQLNQGPVVKVSANKSYSTIAKTHAKFLKIAESAGVKTQTFYNHSDRKGGSTIGSITESITSIPTIDVGVPMLAMHSIRETGGVFDIEGMLKIFKEFFKGEK